ncbi:HLA class II histocompatibility antigen, DM alpha chain-like isoform X2 [Bufo gargarizans]|uniref:HLA class II histocompatibility antigen, DM alpha chain-like isoform X2 n=1 Tax=Bufo gargarizans TaxID=30331 RepID=UPI001CF2F501|nr:HLA class II histocompatibility antigen, DM alpha chain-like isoform X2 [Bufo gargarizans]
MNMPQLCLNSPQNTLVLLVPLLAMLGHCDDDHLLSQVLFCQPTEPSSGLLKMFDEDQMFSYNFSNNTVTPWISDFHKWRDQAFPNPSTITSHVKLCNRFREELTKALENITPEARGGAQVAVFTGHPLRLGVENTLICAISDVYPPALTVTWRKDAKNLTTSLISSQYFAKADLSFQAFSYLNVTPHHNDVFSCEVQVAGDNRTIVQYWIPQYPIPSDLMENVLCGLGFSLGIIFLLAGFILLCFAKK